MDEAITLRNSAQTADVIKSHETTIPTIHESLKDYISLHHEEKHNDATHNFLDSIGGGVVGDATTFQRLGFIDHTQFEIEE